MEWVEKQTTGTKDPATNQQGLSRGLSRTSNIEKYLPNLSNQQGLPQTSNIKKYLPNLSKRKDRAEDKETVIDGGGKKRRKKRDGDNTSKGAKDKNDSELTPQAFRAKMGIKVDRHDCPNPFLSFEATPFPKVLLDAVGKAGFSSPSAIQSQCWPIALAGKDFIAIAKTGSGKTLGFLFPAFSPLSSYPSAEQVRAVLHGAEGNNCVRVWGRAERLAAQRMPGRVPHSDRHARAHQRLSARDVHPGRAASEKSQERKANHSLQPGGDSNGPRQVTRTGRSELLLACQLHYRLLPSPRLTWGVILGRQDAGHGF
eukprot:1650614-Rhodomonas_salina.1